ncbi:NUMOD4 domain-containing protein [Atopobiaceae bacterium HCP3S3_F7]|uniref:NUMOD4 domain-containing protein n=1 Tax=unclassified Collinsella TaxID=2637548 RepID=UPI003F8E9611
MEESWKPITNFEGKYEVSNLGNVRSLKYRNSSAIKLLVLTTNADGRKYVDLYQNGNRTRKQVHTLVAIEFVPNPDSLKEINHIDENPLNNRADNLEWCTRKYNVNYGSRNIRHSKAMKNGKLSKAVEAYSCEGNLVYTFPSASEAGRNGFHASHVSACCRGELKSHKGLVWKYINKSKGGI